MKALLPIILASALVLGANVKVSSQQLQEPQPTVGIRPFPGLVPDEWTAIEVARILLTRYLGKKEMRKIQLSAKIEGKVWIVRGSYDMKGAKNSIDQDVGQLVYPVVRINQQTCSAGISLN